MEKASSHLWRTGCWRNSWALCVVWVIYTDHHRDIAPFPPDHRPCGCETRRRPWNRRKQPRIGKPEGLQKRGMPDSGQDLLSHGVSERVACRPLSPPPTCADGKWVGGERERDGQSCCGALLERPLFEPGIGCVSESATGVGVARSTDFLPWTFATARA